MRACNHRTAGIACLLLTVATATLGGCGHTVPFTVTSAYGVDDPQFVQTMGNLFGQGFITGNRITTLVDREIFPAMIQAICAAEKSITFETFIFGSGDVPRQFTEALAERAKAGVKVHMMLDAVGGGGPDREQLAAIVAAGGDVRFYNPLRWWEIGSTFRLTYRTHRKLLVIDGREGFIGGAGVADDWGGDDDDRVYWRDNHYHVQGPVVGRLQAAFMENWIEQTGQVLHGDEYFPRLEPAGDTIAQVINSSTRSYDENVQVMYMLSIAAARRRLCLATPYFVPDDITVRELCNARQRGVQVQVIVPTEDDTDSPLTHQASRAGWGKLLEAGVEIYEYQPTMYHPKLMIVDEVWTSIGSANLDNRSFRLNDETNLNVPDADFAAQQLRLFEADLARSRRVDHEQWKKRPWWKKLLDGSSTVLESQL